MSFSRRSYSFNPTSARVDGVDKVVKEVLARLGGVDILINNVGGFLQPSGGVLALRDEDWQQTFNANLFAAVRLDRALLPKMLEQSSGVIIHISSIQRTSRFLTQPWRMLRPRRL